jgi:hypothetical protein
MLERGLLEKCGGDTVGGSTVVISAASVNRWIEGQFARSRREVELEPTPKRLTVQSARVDERGFAFGPLVPEQKPVEKTPPDQ